MQNAINGTGNGGSTKPETSPVKLNTVTSVNYGDYVDYPVSIGRGPAGIAETHKSDWRIFYNDGTYVYLIASYLLLNSQMPTGTNMAEESGRPYATYWKNSLPEYKEISSVARNQYKMSWNKSTTNDNIKCVSELLDTSKWTKFVNNQYAIDAIGAPTLEMWVESWNQSGGKTLYYNNSNEYGYHVGATSNPTGHSVSVPNDNTLYLPVKEGSNESGYRYCLASPSSESANYLMCVSYIGAVTYTSSNYDVSVRPLVRLNSSTTAKKDANGVWKLQ